MTDRAKTIKALECCVANCKKDCPYWGHCHHDPEGVSLQFLEDALELLREQEPVKPIFDEQDVSGRCGVCGHALNHQSMVGNVLVDEWFGYCPRCGRKVNWNDGSGEGTFCS